MNPRMSFIAKLTLAVLLLLCLANMPYGFYQLVRFLAMMFFALFSYEYYKGNQKELGFVFAALAILFQPFVKITLGRSIWNILDLIVAILLTWMAVVAFRKRKK